MPPVSIQSERTKFFDQLFRGYQEPAFSIRTFDGWTWRSSRTHPLACTVVLKTPGALRALLDDPSELTLGEAFIEGHLDIQGDIVAAFAVARHLFSLPVSLPNRGARLLRHCLSDLAQTCLRGRRHSAARDRSSIASHYDLPAEFYLPWLGNGLVYSCAYFRSPSDSLEQAQENKLELICRKLRLGQGDGFLDIGCGWGSLILHAAREHGVEAHGITLSRAQAAVATRRITQANIGRACAAEFRDYREAGKIGRQFEKIASIGMFEHVGLSHLKQYFEIVFTMLLPGGLFLNHGIARSAALSSRPKESFIDKHVFPDGELVTLSQAIQLGESAGLEVRDVENLREHYERTLSLWVAGLQANCRSVLKTVSEKTYRTWLIYMAGSAAAFQRGDIAVYQILFRRPQMGERLGPEIRENLYRNWTAEAARRRA
jgi:cyclopropane-fatty-acyl-phospholipid synthase